MNASLLLPVIICVGAFRGWFWKKIDIDLGFQGVFAVAIALTFFAIGVVAIQTKLDQPRPFSYSPEFLHGLSKFIMIGGAILAVVFTVSLTIALGVEQSGWMFIFVPFYILPAFFVCLILGRMIALLGSITKMVKGKRPTPPRGLDSPI